MWTQTAVYYIKQIKTKERSPSKKKLREKEIDWKFERLVRHSKSRIRNSSSDCLQFFLFSIIKIWRSAVFIIFIVITIKKHSHSENTILTSMGILVIQLYKHVNSIAAYNFPAPFPLHLIYKVHSTVNYFCSAHPMHTVCCCCCFCCSCWIKYTRIGLLLTESRYTCLVGRMKAIIYDENWM